MGQTHFGGFEWGLSVGEEATGHRSETMSHKLAGQLGGVEVFGEALRADVRAGCAAWEDVIGTRMPRVPFGGV